MNTTPRQLYAAVLDALPAQLDTLKPHDAMLALLRMEPYRALWLDYNSYITHDKDGYYALTQAGKSAAYPTVRAALVALKDAVNQ